MPPVSHEQTLAMVNQGCDCEGGGSRPEGDRSEEELEPAEARAEGGGHKLT